ncbi:MAG: GAF domain-containing protein [Spirochaetes bacterium]|nr:GAF domain-containing protein [Spirochaetota bacterium]MBN2769607.1 GAF domain-containing protein [Spirochaetota bacterium]
MEKNEQKLKDISDIITELDDNLSNDTIFLDLEEDSKSGNEQYISRKNLLNASDKIILDIAKEISGANSLRELYEILIFTAIGQLGISSASIIHPSTVSTERWILAEHHGMRLRNRNLTFKLNDTILSKAINKKEIIYLDDFQSDINAQEEYQKFFSIGASLIAPAIINENLMFALVVGSKLKQEEFSGNDIVFLNALLDITSVIFSKISQIDKLKNELKDLATLQKRLDMIDNYEADVRKTSTHIEIDNIIQKELSSLQINSYALFFRNDSTNMFEILFTEKEDLLHLKRKGYEITSSNAFISYCFSNDTYTEIENPVTSQILKTVFNDDFLLRINVFGVYPYLIKKQLLGFLLLLRVNLDVYTTHINQVKRFSRFIFSHLQTSKYLIYSKSFSDVLQPLLTRMRELQTSCQNSRIPLTLIIIKIGGYSNYIQSVTLQQIALCNTQIESIFDEKLQDGDYAFRFDIDRYIVALPGRKKRAGLGYSTILKRFIDEIEEEFTVIAAVHEIPKDGSAFEEFLKELS